MQSDTPNILNWFSQFGVTEETIRQTLSAATQHGADDAELYFEHSSHTSIGLSDRAVNRAHTGIDLGVGIRVVVGDQVGYAYTEDLEPKSMQAAARTAASVARSNQSPAPVQITVGRPANHYPVSRYWSDVDLALRVPLIQQWEERAFGRDPRVTRVQCSLADTDKRVLIARADGLVVGDYRPMTRGFVTCTVEDGGVTETGADSLAARADLDFYNPDRQHRMVDSAVSRALRSLDAGSPPAGEMTVVLAAGSSGILLHEAIGHGMEADFNRKNISIYADKVNQRIANPHVTIVDDATLPGARGSLNVDDEGSPTERTVLVEGGVLKSFLHDRISARHYGLESTGSGRRESFRHPVLPRMRSTYMESGPHDPQAIIASVKRGLYCETFSNGQVQIGAGDFAFYVRHGYLIEDGKLTQPVKDVNLIGNGPKVLETIDMVGDDMKVDEGGWTCGKEGQGVPVSQGMPTVRVGNLSVGGGRA